MIVDRTAASQPLVDSSDSGQSTINSQPSTLPNDWLRSLLRLYNPTEAAAWLHSSHPQLNGRTPMQALRHGRQNDVARIVDQLASGAFV